MPHVSTIETSQTTTNKILDGVIWKGILSFFFPILLGTFFQQLYNTVDAIVVGQFLGKQALAAVGGGTSTIINLLIGFFTGLSSGASVVISQRYGSGRMDRVSNAIHTAIALSVVGGIIITVLGLAMTDFSLALIDTPEDVHPLAALYMKIYFGGSLTLVVYNMASGIFRALGDSRHPLYFLIAGCVTNIVLDVVLVGFVGMGVEGAAISTCISRGVSVLLLFIILLRKHIPSFPRRLFTPFPWGEMRRLLKIGVPSAGEQLSYSLSQVVISFFINMISNEALATRTYCVNIVMFGYLFSLAMAQGGAISIGHLVGREKFRAAYTLGKRVMRLSVGASFSLSLLTALAGPYILSFLTDNPWIIATGSAVLWIDVALETGRAVNFFAVNALRSAGDIYFPVSVGIAVMWSVSVLGSWLLGIHLGLGLVAMWVAFMLDEDIRGIIFIFRWRSMKWVGKQFTAKP